ncbi:lytic transglycosylase domain-containing protein [Arthrobacter yangruifuii]|nr:lytic transglycosylase domain-containing protein [Arthrobacter yangruifuii]
MSTQSTTGSQKTRSGATGMPRKLSVAVTTAAIPAVMLSALALAEPAAAAPAAPQNSLFPQLPLQAVKNLNTGVATSHLATQMPATLPAESAAPATHRIVSGDTVISIAVQYGLSPDELLRVNNLQPTSLIFAGDDLRLAGTSAPAAPAAAAAAAASPGGTYTVVSGDTLGAIAAKHGVSLSGILAANGLSLTSVIYPGQTLRMDSQAAPAAPDQGKTAPAAGASYTVAAGDTLSAIAAKHGVSLSGVLASNGLTQSSVIRPGQQLRVDGSTVSVTAAAPASAPTDLVPNTFLHYTYPDHVVADANLNKQALNSVPVPDRAQMQQIVADTAAQMGVDPALAQAFAFQESGFDQRAVSPANAIGTMQVIPSSGEWASDLVGRKLNLLDPYDNATAGVAIISALIRSSDSLETAIASYYQGQYSVTTHGMFDDTRGYVRSVLAHRASFQ